MTDMRALKMPLDWLEVIFFLAAIFLAPVGVAIGLLGSLLTWIRKEPAPA